MCVSRVLRKRIDEEIDETCIVQPGRYIPKGQYVRRRAYTKQHKSAWEAAIAKYKHVKCIFQNCHFLALSVEDMISHFGYCNGDGSFAKFTCPYCEGRVTSEKILGIHIQRSHGFDHDDIINNHFLDLVEEPMGSIQFDSKECFNPENERNTITDVKIESLDYEYSEEVLPPTAKTGVCGTWKHNSEGVNTYDNEFNCEEEIEMEESIVPSEQITEKSYRGDHIYSKRIEKVSDQSSFSSLLVMRNNNVKHYSGPGNLTDKIPQFKAEEASGQNVKSVEGSSEVNEETHLTEKSGFDNDNSGKVRMDMVKFSFNPEQSTRRKINQSFTNSWNQSIKTNGFARCLVATCNFISLDIFHIQNHFKTCSGVPANGPNLCKICNSWLPSAIELSIHSERCKIYKNLMDHSQVFCDNKKRSGVFDVNCEETNQRGKDPLNGDMSENDTNMVSKSNGNVNKNDGTREEISRKGKVSALRISDIIKLKDNGKLDLDHIIQSGPALPKHQYLRRRAYTKQHKTVWEAALEKHKYVKCIFQNCHFVAMSLEDMIYHFGYCIGDGSFAKFECPHCGGRLTTKMVLDIHIKISHPDMALDDLEDYLEETDGHYGSNADDIFSSVEELKKLVNSKEIKTYQRHSKRSKMKDAEPLIKCEPFDGCETNEGPLSYVTVVLEENQTSLNTSSSGCEKVSVELDLNSSNADDAYDVPVPKTSEEYDPENEIGAHGNTTRISVSERPLTEFDEGSGQENSQSNAGDAVQPSLGDESYIAAEETQRPGSRFDINQRVVGRVNEIQDLPKESQDPGTNERGTDQERTPKEGGKGSQRKVGRNGKNSRGEARKRGRSDGEGTDSTSNERLRRLQSDESLGKARREKSESKNVNTDVSKGSKRKVRESINDEEGAVEASRKHLRVDPVEDEGGTKPLRRRGRPPKKLTQSVQDSSTLVLAKAGCKREKKEEPSQLEIDDDSEVKCAKCEFTGRRKRFLDHNLRKHVGLSWIDGETPIDLSDEKVISARVRQAFRGRKSATCEICRCVKRSALGFVTHVQNCGKSEEEKEALKVGCPHCPARVLKYSLPMHLKLSHSDRPQKENDFGKAVEEGSLLTKRKSAIRATNKFQEVLEYSDDDSESSALYVMYEKGMSKFPKIPSKIRGLWKKMISDEKKIPCRRGSCLTESATVQEARRHHFMCPELPEKSYVCQFCDFYSPSEEYIQEHVKIHPKTDGDFTVDAEEEIIEEQEEQEEIEHKDVEVEEELDDATTIIKNRSRTSENAIDVLEATYRKKFFMREHMVTVRNARFCRQSLRMTLSSELEEVVDGALPLPQFRTNTDEWIGVALSNIQDHFPSLEESMKFCVTRNEKAKDGPWRKLKRFEGEVLEGTSILFTGGSVLSMSWCRNSCVRSCNQNPREYLAVSSAKDMRKFQDIHEVPENLCGCVQIWDCGVLKAPLETPKLMAGIIHDSGQVWDLSWLPVDTFEERMGEGGAVRVGVLAGACQDGTIRMWSICDSQSLKSKFRSSFYRTEPKVILRMEGDDSVGCLRLAIGKTGVIAGGYKNGMIAIWNLKAISSPFCKIINKTFVLKPHLSFQAHRTSIIALSICPTNNRFIATSGLDRYLRLWDLECVVSPIESTIRDVCLENVWPLHWPMTMSTLEDVVRCAGKGMVKAFRDSYCEKHRAPLNIDYTCWSLSVNDWLNIICVCNSKGEVKVRYMRNMFLADERFRLRTGHLFSATDLVLINEKELKGYSSEGKVTGAKEKKAPTVAKTYEEACQHFGLNFIDYTILESSKHGKHPEKKNEIQSMEEYPIASVNKVCWNPNYNSFTFLATGHQSGFVRIKQLEDINCEEEVQNFLRGTQANIPKQ